MDQMIMDNAVKIVQGVGLPALFCLWLMFRVEKRLDGQTAVMMEISKAMSAILEHVRGE